MKKILIFSIPFLFIFSCMNDKYGVSEDIVFDQDNILFQDKVLDNGMPVEGAVVSLYGAGERYSDVTDSNGAYHIEIPAAVLPQEGFISMAVFHPDYKSLNITYEAPLDAGTIYDSKDISTDMAKCESCLRISNPRYSELYHLGDNNFSGAINSQFQKESDGVELSFDFSNSTAIETLKISFEAKGIQPDRYSTPAVIVFDEQEIILELSPEDGSYQRYSIEFQNNGDVGTVSFKTSIADVLGQDVDDWEFTSLYIEGLD